MVRASDKSHIILSYLSGSLKNAEISYDNKLSKGFIFSLLNPPVPLGGNIISLDLYVDEKKISKDAIFIATNDEVINASVLSEEKPISFKPFQSARFLIIDNELNGTKKHKIAIFSKLEGFEDIFVPFIFKDTVQKQKEKIILPDNMTESDDYYTSEETIFKNFKSPLILAGRKSYIVCSSNGSLSANWTWMGATYDNGGLYVPPARPFGRVIVEISMDDGIRKRLPNFVVYSKHENGILQTRHDLADLRITRTLFVPPYSKGFVMKLQLDLLSQSYAISHIKSKYKPKTKHKLRLHFIIDGNITSYGLAAISQINRRHSIKEENALMIETGSRKGIANYYGMIGIWPKNLSPSNIITDSFDNNIEISYDLDIEYGKGEEIAFIGTGSYSNSKDCLGEYINLRDKCDPLYDDTVNHFKNHMNNTLNIDIPTSKNTLSKLIRAYNKAKNALEYLKADYEQLGPGICAGLPRFPNFWARDTGWSLRGYISIGDYIFSAQVIDNFLKHQARRSSKLALKGELPMIISGKYFLHDTTYGSADSTFLFPWAIYKYVKETGDVAYLNKRWRSIVNLIDFGFLKDMDRDGLIDHGFSGIAEKLPIPDSTWMDHIDRKKSANDVQALYYESLIIGSKLAAIRQDKENEVKWQREAERIQFQVDKEYWNNSFNFYYDTIRMDLNKDISIRPNALVLLLSGIVKEKSKAESVLSRIEKNDMTTPWGVRTLSSLDPKYHPSLYHDGAVWPLVTAWMALAEIKYNRYEQALYYLESMADRIIAENGMFAETYRGDRPEPFNSCILQAWSVALYTYALKEFIIGMNIDLIENKITINPHIPDLLIGSENLTCNHYVTDRNDNKKKIFLAINNEKKLITIRLTDFQMPPEITSDSYTVELIK